MLSSLTHDMGTLAMIFILFSIITNFNIQSENLHFAKWIKTCNGDNLTIYCFENILTKGVDKCVHTCKANKECRYINYNIRSKTCSFIGMVNNSIFQDFKQECSVEPIRGYIFGNKSEWNMNKYETCKECKHQGACETTKTNTLCQLSGCGPPVSRHFTDVNGNMFGIGDKIEYECIDGYNMKVLKYQGEHGAHGKRHVTAVSQENASWAYTDFECVKRCGPPVSRHFTDVNGNMFGIGDKIEYECIDGYIIKVLNYHGEHGDHRKSHVTADCKENASWAYTDFECVKHCVLANVARGKTVTLSSQYNDISLGELMVDGNKGQRWPCACTIQETNPWALTDLGQSYSITNITILNRLYCCPERLHDLAVHIGDDPTSLVVVARHKEPVYASHTFIFDESVRGRYVKLQIEAEEFLTICELEVYACN